MQISRCERAEPLRYFTDQLGVLTANERSHRRMRLAACGTPVAVKRRAVEPVNKVKILPV
jgi:hypothetical protein